jgi:hypothetical protein
VLSVDQILKALKTTREEFGRLFLQAQAKANVGARDRKHFEAVAASQPETDAFRTALLYAQAQGWLGELLDIVIAEGLEDGGLTRALAESRAGGDAALQAMTSLANGFTNPDTIYRGFGDGIRWTGKVIVDGQPNGTGVLIGPHLVLTAWHVIKNLFAPAIGDRWEPDANGGARLQVEFDDFLAFIGRTLRPSAPQRVRAHREWCVSFSPCHADELSDKLPADPLNLQGHWDYAIIRLEAAPGLLRRWASLDARSVVPRANESLFLFQHPAMQPLKVDQNFITNPDPPLPSVVPRLRFLHYANAVGGSSGGPCFDKSFMLFGIHQGVWTGAGGAGRVTNRGVPIKGVIDDIKAKLKEGLPGLDPSENPIWSLGPAKNYAPVIGTEPFQKLVWASAVAGATKVLVIGGAKKTGKSFLVQLLSSMLSDGGHLKVTLEAGSISKMNARQLAEAVCKAAGTTLPPTVNPADADTTRSAWLKDEVLTKVVSALQAARAGRLVWLSITELNNYKIVEKDASELLFMLYEQALAVDWLRVVLDGMRADLPRTLRDVTKTHLTTPLTREDILRYFERFLAEINSRDSFTAAVIADVAHRKYSDMLARTPETAMEGLYEEIMIYVEAYQKRIGGGA